MSDTNTGPVSTAELQALAQRAEANGQKLIAGVTYALVASINGGEAQQRRLASAIFSLSLAEIIAEVHLNARRAARN